MIEAWPKNARGCHSATIAEVRDNRDLLCPDGKEASRFRVSLLAEMGLNRSNGGMRPGFVESVLALINTFYEQVVQHMTPWQPTAPRPRRSRRNPTTKLASDAQRTGASARQRLTVQKRQRRAAVPEDDCGRSDRVRLVSVVGCR